MAIETIFDRMANRTIQADEGLRDMFPQPRRQAPQDYPFMAERLKRREPPPVAPDFIGPLLPKQERRESPPARQQGWLGPGERGEPRFDPEELDRRKRYTELRAKREWERTRTENVEFIKLERELKEPFLQRLGALEEQVRVGLTPPGNVVPEWPQILGFPDRPLAPGAEATPPPAGQTPLTWLDELLMRLQLAGAPFTAFAATQKLTPERRQEIGLAEHDLFGALAQVLPGGEHYQRYLAETPFWEQMVRELPLAIAVPPLAHERAIGAGIGKLAAPGVRLAERAGRAAVRSVGELVEGIGRVIDMPTPTRVVAGMQRDAEQYLSSVIGDIATAQKALDTPGRLSKDFIETFGVKTKPELRAELGRLKAQRFYGEALQDAERTGLEPFQPIQREMVEAGQEIQARYAPYHGRKVAAFQDMSIRELEGYETELRRFVDIVDEGMTMKPEVAARFVIPEIVTPTLEYNVTLSDGRIIKSPKPGFDFTGKVEGDFKRFQKLGELAPATEYDSTRNILIQEPVLGRFVIEEELPKVRKLIEAKGLIPRGLLPNDVIVTPEGHFKVVDVGNFELKPGVQLGVEPSPLPHLPAQETGIPEVAPRTAIWEIEKVMPYTTTPIRMRAHPFYSLAKAGDVIAARKTIRDIIRPEMMAEVKRTIKSDDIIVPVIAQEKLGRNKLPLVFADEIAKATGARVETDIVQTVRAFHTEASAIDRLLNRPRFDGTVIAGKTYVLVDDYITLGGTMSELANYISQKGGRVRSVVVLSTAGRGADRLRPSPELLKNLERRFGNVIEQELGVRIPSLTQSEAIYLNKFVSIDRLRDRITTARGQKGPRITTEAVAPTPRLPAQEIGMPEAGLQAAMEGMGVAARPFVPAARGVPTQIGMDDALRLAEMRAEAVAPVRAVTPELQALATEAKKYKTAEEFAEAQPKVFHGGAGIEALERKFEILTPEQKQKLPSSTIGLTGLSMTTDKQVALQYSRNIGQTDKILELNINPNARVLRINTKGAGIDEIYSDNEINKFIRQGYDAIQDLSKEAESEYRALTPNAIAVKKELVSIWEHAQALLESPATPRSPDITPSVTPPALPRAIDAPVTPDQADTTVRQFGTMLRREEGAEAWELTQQWRTEILSQRAARMRERTVQLVEEAGISPEDAIKQARHETLAGELPRAFTELGDGITPGVREALFSRVYHVLADEPLEMVSTTQALTNALLGRAIPRKLGTAGMSAYTRLLRVFPEEIVKALDDAIPLEKIIGDAAGITDRDLVDYVRRLPVYQAEQLGLTGRPPIRTEGLAPDPRTAAERELDLQTFKTLFGEPPTPIQRPMDVPVGNDAAMHQIPLMPDTDRNHIIQTMKAAGWTAVDIGNFMRANLASADLSWWRQMASLIFENPGDFVVANGQALRAVWSQSHADQVMRNIYNHKYYGLYENLGLDFLRLLDSKSGKAWQRAEEFMVMGDDRAIPRLVNKLPWVKISARAHTTGCNKMSWDIFTKHVDQIFEINEKIAAGEIKLKPGKAFDIKKEVKSIGSMLADMSGRGPLGPLKELSPALNAGFFSARLNIGRLFTPRHLISSSPYTRKVAWRTLLKFVASMSAPILLGKYMGLWDTELDPRNPDFMKIRIGKTRADVWGGYQQYIRLFCTLITKERISAISGRKSDADVMDTISRFFQSKAAPLPSLIMDFWTGKTFLGEDTDIANPQQWIDRIIPFALQDMYEAFEGEGIRGLFWGASAIVGAGVGTYEYILGEMRREWTDDLLSYYNIPTDATTRKAQGLPTRLDYRRRHPEVDAKLFILGEVTSLRSPAAQRLVTKLIAEHEIDVELIRGLKPKEEGEAARHLREVLRGGQVDVTEGRREPIVPFPPAKWTPRKSIPERQFDAFSQEAGSFIIMALERIWYDKGTPTAEERRQLEILFHKYPMGAPNFNTWLKQTLRQQFERRVEGK